MDLSQFPTIRVAACDLNGQWRGKRLPGRHAGKLDKGTIRMPLSALNVDIWGADIKNSPLVFATGDADGVLIPSDRGAVPMPWLASPSALVPMTMIYESGAPFLGDPRQALAAVLQRYSSRGWQVMAATEMEFSLVDDSGKTLRPPRHPRSNRRLFGADILSLDELDAFDAFFTDLHAGCDAMGLPVQSIINESGLGQFEVTLSHQPALTASDNAILFKSLTRGTARNHGMAATFMAKPYADDAGNGMHVHFSVLDHEGYNIFDNGGPDGSEMLHQAVAGCLAAMPASTLIFAPHGVSYSRFAAGAHAPTAACWAYENRTAAIRIPGGASTARRIEHRVAGGDANPYLMLAIILAAAFLGIKDRMTPAAPITGNAYDRDLPQLAPDWATAIEMFASDPIIARCLPKQLIDNLLITKRQELQRLAKSADKNLWKLYLQRA